MNITELTEKLEKLSLEDFSAFIKKNYGKLLREPKKLGAILKIYGDRVMKEGNHKKMIRDSAIDELMLLNLDSEGGGKKWKH